MFSIVGGLNTASLLDSFGINIFFSSHSIGSAPIITCSLGTCKKLYAVFLNYLSSKR
jgi:hypothetical protein